MPGCSGRFSVPVHGSPVTVHDMVRVTLGTVRRAAQQCGLKEAAENEEWTVYWTDSSVTLERLMEMKRFQVNRTAAQQELLREEGGTRLAVEQHVAE